MVHIKWKACYVSFENKSYHGLRSTKPESEFILRPTVSRPVCLGIRVKAPVWGLRPDFY
jgi:hypothetical protein